MKLFAVATVSFRTNGSMDLRAALVKAVSATEARAKERKAARLECPRNRGFVTNVVGPAPAEFFAQLNLEKR